ncbi:aldo/keto reductase [Microvirga guangxiensis]|uniref:Predicted oxidoreductase n=1 Tax=Microvirga guangxiensis TaxID=549386 RepID=A0A1G5G769_9HYPH|nr:aldo/keto reductase [Microvirga guangxiensis]SCY47466.1 Predicted oxidoreductase [Microvirga guangxiensis]
MNGSVCLGLGLLSIGRAWGYRNGFPPPEEDALALLEHAVSQGITVFDTAPAYGTSERILGRFLRGRTSQASHLTIATKMGEHWNAEEHAAFTDHSYDALCRSLDQSLERLGRIDLLQIHKASAAVLASKDVERAIAYARSSGVRNFGASVSDLDAACLACASGTYTTIQFPYNRLSAALRPAFDMALSAGMDVFVNRPFGMGEIVPNEGDKMPAMQDALTFILHQSFKGAILTGTRSLRHLDESITAFSKASASINRIY